ncbi:MAG TPA: 2OG-Fe(II) oxygenase [Microthrixaceae bacterium]|nr:2OG-Fe(II) oxygenase [Microthrixaceae bacterium]
MGSSVGEDLSALLRGVQGRGSFATCRTAPVGELAIEITGVGDLAFPVTAAQAKQLRLVARPAKYGQGEQTILDRRVRDTWEIPRSRVRIDKRRWNRTLGPMLDTIRDDLGLPPTSSLSAQLHSMLLYERGQFFAAHQDSEKDDEMVASLVVMLPSRATGGDLVVSHRSESVSFHGSASSLTFVAFYADTRHEVLPVETGHRVVLTYNLSLRGETMAPLTDDPSAVTATAELLGRHFNELPAPRWRNDRQAAEPPDRLVVLLDHQYTERGLRWSHLKGHDATRVEMLRKAAEVVGCEIALAQAEIQETRDCYEDEPPRWGRSGRSYWDDDDEPDGNDGGFVVGEILDSSIMVVPGAGESLRFDSTVNEAEIVEVTPTDELKPYDSEYTGYMGNWGNTLDRWYRRAALVIWPHTRSFAIRAKGDPAAAIGELLERPATDESSRRGRADDTATLLRFWADAVRRDDQRSLLPAALQLASQLDDEDLADQLLNPFDVEAIAPGDAAMLVTLTDQHGLGWFNGRLTAWTEQRRAHHMASVSATGRAAWTEGLPALCTNLRDPGHARGRSGPDVAKRLVTAMTDWLVAAIGRAVPITSPSQRESTLAQLTPATVAVLHAARIVSDPHSRDRVVTAVCDPIPRTIPMLVEIVRACAPLPTDERAAIGADTMAMHCREALVSALEQPPRAPHDWSISEFEPDGCCDDCATLTRFLTDPTARTITWPLAKPRRQHIHHRIDDAELPVTHRTRREGSPHKLVLTKTDELHRRDTERRATLRTALEAVEQTAPQP